MKTLFLGAVMSMLLSVFSENSFSQESTTNTSFNLILDGSKYESNTLDSLLNAIYLNCPEYINEDLKAVHLEQLSRFQIVQLSDPEQIPVFGNLASLGIKNKCNPNLSFDTSIDTSSFNPLKYFFNFYPEQTQFIFSGYQDIYFRIEPIK